MATKKTVAIMGATSHLAKSLIRSFSDESSAYALRLFTRRPAMVRSFLDAYTDYRDGDSTCSVIEGYDRFLDGEYDAIINCVGIGTIRKHQGEYAKYFTVYERFDNLALDYLHRQPKTRYISLGSGSVYGNHFERPADLASVNPIPVNGLKKEDYYALTRLYSEAKHRAWEDLPIVDFRIFSFFSRFHDPADGYFIDQVIGAIRNNVPFLTGRGDFYRDYLHPADLYRAICQVLASGQASNGAYDICSKQPVMKSELLAFYERHYNLRVDYRDDFSEVSATGQKFCYFSTYRASGAMDFQPAFSSLDAIREESLHLLASQPTEEHADEAGNRRFAIQS